MSDPTPGRDDCGILARSDGASIAYRRVIAATTDTPRPTVIFLHGLMSDMEGSKALHLHAYAESQGLDYLRFDMQGHGLSSGKFTDGCIGRWLDDALAVIDDLTEGPLLLVGSSMGGWVGLLAAVARPDRVEAFVGIAPAPDFTEDSMWAGMTPSQKAELAANGIVEIADADNPCGTFPITKLMIEDGRKNLLLRQPIRFAGPVRILQGMQDTSVDWHTALKLADALDSPDTQITLIKDGDHRLSRPQDLALLTRTLDALIGEKF
jgi:pimeloyl-ACP methyl ester carboxylesterase